MIHLAPQWGLNATKGKTINVTGPKISVTSPGYRLGGSGVGVGVEQSKMSAIEMVSYLSASKTFRCQYCQVQQTFPSPEQESHISKD